MARKVALIPEELISSYLLQKPELRLEDDIVKLLDKGKLPDDMKVKLLGQLITRYEKTVHETPDPVRVTFDEDKQKLPEMRNEAHPKEESDPILKDIVFSVPTAYSKFIPLIIEKLKTRGYGWNELGELTQDNHPIKHSRIVDFFAYLLRNSKTQSKPPDFDIFFHAIREINIPRSWIGNKRLLLEIKDDAEKLGVNAQQKGFGRVARKRQRTITPAKLRRVNIPTLTNSKWKKY